MEALCRKSRCILSSFFVSSASSAVLRQRHSYFEFVILIVLITTSLMFPILSCRRSGTLRSLPPRLLLPQLRLPRYCLRAISRLRTTDDSQAGDRSLIALIRCSHIPDVGFERVSSTADAHFCEVADSVLGAWVVCEVWS